MLVLVLVLVLLLVLVLVLVLALALMVVSVSVLVLVLVLVLMVVLAMMTTRATRTLTWLTPQIWRTKRAPGATSMASLPVLMQRIVSSSTHLDVCHSLLVPPAMVATRCVKLAPVCSIIFPSSSHAMGILRVVLNLKLSSVVPCVTLCTYLRGLLLISL